MSLRSDLDWSISTSGEKFLKFIIYFWSLWPRLMLDSKCLNNSLSERRSLVVGSETLSFFLFDLLLMMAGGGISDGKNV